MGALHDIYILYCPSLLSDGRKRGRGGEVGRVGKRGKVCAR
jgi:hypothetical protein